MDIFRRLTTPSLKKLYRFVLQRLVGRFLDDDIALEQLDVHLRAGRIELTDLNINVRALAELLPSLSFRLSRARVGRLRVEISYSKLLTDSLAFFADDVLIEITPPPESTDELGVQDDTCVGSLPNENPALVEIERHDVARARSRGAVHPESTTAGLGPTERSTGEEGESLDLLARWIEQITSKVKVVVQNLTVRIASSGVFEGSSAVGQGSESNPFLEIGLNSLKWCDETPESSSFVTERPSRPHAASSEGTERVGAYGAIMTQKRLTMSVIWAHWNGGVGGRKREVARINGTNSIVIKHGRRPQPGSTSQDDVLDIDVSLRHADISFAAEDCAGLRTLSSAYLIRSEKPATENNKKEAPVPDNIGAISPLFREDFWYFDGLTPPGDNSSSELNFDTLSRLLEQYSAARARLVEAGGFVQAVDGGEPDLSLEQSDVFYDCVEADSDQGSGNVGGNAHNPPGHGAAKLRLRMSGFDLTLLLGEETTDNPSSDRSAIRICFQARRLIHTLHHAGKWKQYNADIGTFVANFTDESAGCSVRMLEIGVLGASDSSTPSPCIQVKCSRGNSTDPRVVDRGAKGDVTSVDVQCLPVAAVVDARWTGMLSEFIAQSRSQERRSQDGSSQPKDVGGDQSGRTPLAPADNTADAIVVDDQCVTLSVSIPKVLVRLPVDPAACSSVAYNALISSIQNGTSPVGWTRRESLERAPALMVEVQDVVLTSCFGSPGVPLGALECSKVVCEIILIDSEDIAGIAGGRGGELNTSVIGLYFLEASRSASETPVKVEYGRAEDMGRARKSGAARRADADDLEFLHTWEPNDGVESGLGEGSPPASFRGERREANAAEAASFSLVLLCDLPRLALELSRLELVVLVDILGALTPSADSPSARSAPLDVDKRDLAPSSALEVLVEARGASIVLHEAVAFAEEPGPHSYVLNLGSASLQLGGGEESVEGHPAPLVTVSAGDACVHEILRCSVDDDHSIPCSRGRGRKIAPLLFLPRRTVSVYPSTEDLASIGFVPVLYQTKWAKGTSPITAQLALALSGLEADSVCDVKTITATLNLYDVSLRYRVTSSWLPRLLGLLVGDVPPGRVASNTCQPGLEETGGNLTKMFITVFNGVVDYMPQMQMRSADSVHGATLKLAGIDSTSEDNALFTKGRVVLPFGVLRVSSNMVAGALMQGFKVVIRDIGLHISNREMDYTSEDSGLCCGALQHGGGQRVDMTGTKAELSSVQEYIEKSFFVQIATLNFLDAFLRIRTQVVRPRDAFIAVELWMGILRVYTCQDSLTTSQVLLGEWCAFINECRTAAADLGQNVESEPKPQTGKLAEDNPGDVAPTSLLDDVQQDAFLPGTNNRGSPTWTQAEANSGVNPIGEGQYPSLHSHEQQSLVIEDYYCVSVHPADQETPAGPLDSLKRDPPIQADPVEEQSVGHSSLISEGEGPAQWLAAPKAGPERVGDLAMESAGESSDSEEEKGGGAIAFGLASRQQSLPRRSNFGFSLPAPIEIELEDRREQNEEGADAKDMEEVLPSPLEEPSPSVGGEMEESTSKTDSIRNEHRDMQAADLWPQRRSDELNDAQLTPAITPTNSMQLDEDMAPVSGPMVTSRQGNLPVGKRAGSSEQRGRASSGYSSDIAENGFSAESAYPSKAEILLGEQEARWLTKDAGASLESRGAPAIGTRASSNHTDKFRVYPHYIPIPSTAEATCLPSLLPGDRLQPLGRDPQDSGNSNQDEAGSSERPDQALTLQSQLAIHDLTICWRLFKGRDWVERSSSAKDRADNESEGRRHLVNAKVWQDPDYVADSGSEGHHLENGRERDDISKSSVGTPKARKSELLDTLLENYQGGQGGHGDGQTGRRGPRQPKVKRLNVHREGGSTRSSKRSGRDTSCMLEILLEHSSLRLDTYHPGPPPSLLSNMLFSIKDIYASDTLTSSRPRKTLQHWRDDVRHPREFHQKMVTVRMTARSPSDHFCPEDTPLGDEIMLKVRLLPLHLSFGQHTVDFLRSFTPPVDTSPGTGNSQEGRGNGCETDNDTSPFFVSCLDVGACKVKIDYQPRAIKVRALQHGDYLELLNLFPLEGVHLALEKLLLTGVSGWNGVMQVLLQSWVQDITSNQLHKFLAGTTPVRPLVTVGKGVADLVLLPVEQYRRDGRVLRGLRKGTQSFLRAVTIETLHTSHRVASFVARTLDDIVTQPGSRASLRGLEYYDEQPTGVLDSLEHAYDALAKEVQVAAQTIIAIPYEEQEEVIGPHGRSYVRSVARALPVAVLRPVVGASEALSCTLLGFRNFMSPVIRKEEEGRWR